MLLCLITLAEKSKGLTLAAAKALSWNGYTWEEFYALVKEKDVSGFTEVLTKYSIRGVSKTSSIKLFEKLCEMILSSLSDDEDGLCESDDGSDWELEASI